MKNEITSEMVDIEKEKILLAYNSNLLLHIKLKNETWRNGYVRKIEGDFFIFEDKVNGIEPVFWIELLKVEPYMEVNKKEKENGDRTECFNN